MELELPIRLEDDVTIVSKSAGGAFLIAYRNDSGEVRHVYWPDRFKRYMQTNQWEGRAVDRVQAFLIEQIGKG